MTRSDKIYIFLTMLFSTLIVVGNLTYKKFVALPLLPFYTFELSLGVMFYPCTFLITDLITEFYGKERAKTCVRLGIAISIIVALIIHGMNIIPATPWSKVNDGTFNEVFGSCSIAVIGSLLACFISQTIDVNLYAWIKKVTKDKHLWLRGNGSTVISLFIDTCVMVWFMSFFSIFPKGKMVTLILNHYSFKLFFTLCSTPIFYLLVGILKRLIPKAKV